MKIYLLILMLFLTGCVDTPEQIQKYKNDNTFDIKVLNIEELGNGKYRPDYFIIDENRNSYEIRPDDFVRIKKGDSIQISTESIYAEILRFY